MGENVEERRCRASSIPSLLRPVKSVSSTTGSLVFCGIQVSMAEPARVAFTIYSEFPSYAAHMQTRQWLQMT